MVDLRTQSKSVDFSAATSTKPMQTGSSLPPTCAVGQFFFLTTASAGSNVYACDAVNTWTVEGSSLPVNSSDTNEVLSSNGISTEWLALGGDISGAPGALTVTRLQGRNVSSAAPSSDQVLQWDAATNQWQPAAAETGNASYAFAAQVSITIPGTVHQFGTANLVVACYDNSTPPQEVEPNTVQISPTTYNVTINFTTAQTGYCVVNGAGTASVSGGGGAVTSVFARTGAVMAQTGDYSFGQISGSVGSSQLPSAGGDVSGTLTAATVTGIQNRLVANTAPTSGQALVWNSTASAWQPGTVSGSGAVSSVFGRTGAVASQTGDYGFAQISGSVASSQLPSAGGDLNGTLTAATVTGIQNRVVANTAPTSGQALIWNASASAWQPGTVSGSGAVSSVFGRTGIVTAQSGDYSFPQISGTVGSSQLPSAGGDLSGTLTAATVRAIQGQAVSSTLPGNGQALVWNSAASAWQPSSAAGTGVTMAYQLGDLAAVRASSTALSIGAGCGPTSPCNVRFGYQVYSITNSATATVSGSGIGTAYIYVSPSGTLMVGNNLTVACSAGCIQQAGITSFPPNVLPVYTWTATNGTWDSTGGRDQRAFLSAKTLAAGTGIIDTEAPGLSTLAVDNGVIPTYLMNSATMAFPSIATGGCAADQTLTVAGANPGDAVAPGWPALPAGIFGIMLVSGTNTVTVRLCNLSGSAVTPPSASYKATIVRNY
ncbi:MAG TPA: hypothetical protein VN924_19705 [Bryobacteraceae bacterium]|nr:hypothetical protein [Bryobacteraceae bacterium]